ncbi:MAG: CAP domain-containing protein [Bacillota bacterium]
MRKVSHKGIFVLLALAFLVAAAIVAVFPATAAQAYISTSDYYAQWDKFGIKYADIKGASMETGLTTPGNTVETTPDTTTKDTILSSQTSLYAERVSYYARLLDSKTYAVPVSTPPSADKSVPAPVETPAETPSSPPPPADTSDVASLSAAEQEMLRLVNQERIKAGLHTFVVDMRLVRLARLKSQDMYENNYFDHVSPTYGSPYEMERDAGIIARVMGAENIAIAATVARAHELFMNSEHHRANILDPRHDAIGIGIVTTPYGVYVTQLFLGD